MAKLNKILEKMSINAKNWRMDQLEVVAKHYDINVRKSGGSHVVFEHEACDELVWCQPIAL